MHFWFPDVFFEGFGTAEPRFVWQSRLAARHRHRAQRRTWAASAGQLETQLAGMLWPATKFFVVAPTCRIGGRSVNLIAFAIPYSMRLRCREGVGWTALAAAGKGSKPAFCPSGFGRGLVLRRFAKPPINADCRN